MVKIFKTFRANPGGVRLARGRVGYFRKK